MGTYYAWLLCHKKGRFPIYLNRDAQYIVIYIHLIQCICVGIQSRIRLHILLEFNASETSRKKIFENSTVASDFFFNFLCCYFFF